MKREKSLMNQRCNIVAMIIVVLPFLFLVTGNKAFASKEKDFKLKPGAEGKLCFKCHSDFSKQLEKRYVHSPVKNGECTGCHNPHASDHGKMLAESRDKVCASCHGTMISKNAQSSHKIVREGKCTLCHDPHASNNRNNLIKSGNELCFTCHKDVAAYLKDLSVPHEPLSDCLACHNPHSSDDGDHLLTANPPQLCLDCHDISSKLLAVAHKGYPVQNASCIACHNPHGSNQKNILYDQVHPPVAKGMCNQCHEDPNSANPLATKRKGYKLCRGCHNDEVNDIMGANRLHWAVVGKNGCISCHNPHASQNDALLKGSMLNVCGSCHNDTIQRMKKSVTKHKPIAEGDCTACHSPHSSDNVLLFNKPKILDVCGSCHEWMTHSTHPIGDKYTDPRNENLKLSCLSCHRAHGTEYEHLIPFPEQTNLCVDCHENLRR